MSPATLSKIIQFSKSRQSLQFTAADLSDYMQVTRRSTERILKKLVNPGLVKIVGEEMTYQKVGHVRFMNYIYRFTSKEKESWAPTPSTHNRAGGQSPSAVVR